MLINMKNSITKDFTIKDIDNFNKIIKNLDKRKLKKSYNLEKGKKLLDKFEFKGEKDMQNFTIDNNGEFQIYDKETEQLILTYDFDLMKHVDSNDFDKIQKWTYKFRDEQIDFSSGMFSLEYLSLNDIKENIKYYSGQLTFPLKDNDLQVGELVIEFPTIEMDYFNRGKASKTEDIVIKEIIYHKD